MQFVHCTYCGLLFRTRPRFCNAKCKIAYYRARGRHIPVPNDLRERVFRRDNYTCKVCGCREKLSLDHIKPQSRGGETTLENLQTLCLRCNRIKSNHWEDFSLEEKKQFEEEYWASLNKHEELCEDCVKEPPRKDVLIGPRKDFSSQVTDSPIQFPELKK